MALILQRKDAKIELRQNLISLQRGHGQEMGISDAQRANSGRDDEG
jgi:hypothetical protein